MPAAEWDITIEENSQFDFYITKFDSDCNESDVTGYGAKFQVRDLNGTLIYEATVGSGISVQPSGKPGLFQVTLTISIVNNPGVAGWKKGEYDLVIWPSDGSITSKAKRLVKGRARWSPAVTAPP